MNTFRSHLMQQFVAHARTQSRPPLALAGWIRDDEEDGGQTCAASSTAAAHQSAFAGTTSARPHAVVVNSNSSSKIGNSGLTTSPAVASSGLPLFLSSISSTSEYPLLSNTAESAKRKNEEIRWKLTKPSTDMAHEFQRLLCTRRNRTKIDSTRPLWSSSSWPYDGASTASVPITRATDDALFWANALDRAMECGRSAPHPKRRHNLSVQRWVAPSASTRRLADIVYHVSLQNDNADNDNNNNVSNKSRHSSNAQEVASRKRDKWNQIPGFLVAVVTGNDESSTGALPVNPRTTCTTQGPVPPRKGEAEQGIDPYETLPYVPPATEKELEDYASACAAVQNMLLSLHSERIASKWVTGSLVRTPAFRELVRAKPDDRVVGLIMAGPPSSVHESSVPPQASPTGTHHNRSLFTRKSSSFCGP